MRCFQTKLEATEPDSAAQRQVMYQINLLDNVEPDPMRAPRLFSDKGKGGRLATGVPFRAHVWRFGGMLRLVALTGEPVVDYALRFKSELGWEDTWVSGCESTEPCTSYM